MYDLLDLIFSHVMEQTGLFIEPVSLICEQGMDHVISDLSIHAGTFKHIINAAFPDLSFQLRSVYLSGRTILGDILHKLPPLCQFRQKPHCNDAFPGSGTAFANDSPLLMIPLAFSRNLDDLFIHNTLLVDHYEFFVSLDH